MKKLIIVLFMFLCVQTIQAQHNIRQVSTLNTNGTTSKDHVPTMNNNAKFSAQTLRNLEEIARAKNIPQNSSEPVSIEVSIMQNEFSSEAILFGDVIRRYTWLEGLGEPISQSEANHLPYYYRLSMKNDAGHYQLVEALHGTSLTSSHPLSTYILDKENDINDKNKEWREKLLTVGQWVFYSDLSGENVVEERAYEAKEKNAKLIYSMQPVRNDSSHVTIAYTDSYGYPADMNEDYRFTYGSVVYITYDKQGFDSIIDYLDGEGYRKPNTNGVDQTRNVYDDKGRLLLITSNNCVGDYAIDNWGNCGIKYSYNDKMNTYSKICVDKDLNPMRMPPIRAGIEDTYIRCDIKKDQWGREIEAIMLTAEGEKDATMAGIHRITYSYTNDGRLQKKSYYDINGNPMIIK
ncbi:MAG: hypothetical protein IJK78_14280 [Bacteroidales bacterium]|nr:hypothetical protein [Bacteroidales bacterium]